MLNSIFSRYRLRHRRWETIRSDRVWRDNVERSNDIWFWLFCTWRLWYCLLTDLLTYALTCTYSDFSHNVSYTIANRYKIVHHTYDSCMHACMLPSTLILVRQTNRPIGYVWLSSLRKNAKACGNLTYWDYRFHDCLYAFFFFILLLLFLRWKIGLIRQFLGY